MGRVFAVWYSPCARASFTMASQRESGSGERVGSVLRQSANCRFISSRSGDIGVCFWAMPEGITHRPHLSRRLAGNSLYNTGARADEAAQLLIADLALAQVPSRDLSSVKIRGKGNKERRCPIWPQTVKELVPAIEGRPSGEHLFLNRYGRPITRFGIYGLVERHIKRISAAIPSLAVKHVSPHCIRHTTATHLLRAGVDINTIRAWMGHVSLETTNIYAEVDLEMKAKALAHCEVKGTKPGRRWNEDKGIMAFLRKL